MARESQSLRRLVSTLILMGIFLLATYPSFAQTLPQTETLDVNDVSFLFPLHDSSAYPAINLATDIQLDEAIFKSVLLFENPKQSVDTLSYLDSYYLKDRSYWNVVAVRWDPCGEVLSHSGNSKTKDEALLLQQGKGCQARLRLVVQPFNIFGYPIQTAMHILYSLSDTESENFLSSLLELKKFATEKLLVSTNGLPLMVHPGLEAELSLKKNVGYADHLKSLVLNTILDNNKNSKLPEILTLSVQVQINRWRFVGGLIQKSEDSKQRWTRFVTEFSNQFANKNDGTLLSGSEEITCNGNSICTYRPAIVPTIVNPLGVFVTHIFQNTPEFRRQQAPGQRSDEIHKLSEMIENPKQVNLFNTNCISCHVSSDLRDRQRLHVDPEWPVDTTPFVASKYQTEALSNILNFGYWGTQPRISTRTAAESAAVANSANIKLGYSTANEFIDYLNLNKIWTCFQKNDNYKQCL